MKEVNLISLTEANQKLDRHTFHSYKNFFSVNLRHDEFADLEFLITNLKSCNELIIDCVDNFFVGYAIPQISKEFDLLRFGENEIVNIELKKRSSSERIARQLIQNKYYLSFLNKELHHFTYVSEEDKLYMLDNSNNLVESDFKKLYDILYNQKVIKLDNIDSLFDPAKYLVSPFNSTEEFANGKYFLTVRQDEIKTEVFSYLIEKNNQFVSIKGKAGTGKTLLIYDIAKEYMEKENKVLIIHCGLLNEGHLKFKNDYKWNIIPIKFAGSVNYQEHHVIIIDETQRIYVSQLKLIISQIKKNSLKCIFSFDQQQCLSTAEIINKVEAVIEKEASPKTFELITKIRTNKEIASFITALFYTDRPFDKQKSGNIEINYFINPNDAKEYIELARNKNWKVINYTSSTRSYLPYDRYKIEDEFDNAHKVIGQEFNDVIAVIDEHFCYRENRLSTKNYRNKPYYHPTKMLYQIMSRTRKRINVVIINNEEVLKRCLTILN